MSDFAGYDFSGATSLDNIKPINGGNPIMGASNGGSASTLGSLLSSGSIGGIASSIIGGVTGAIASRKAYKRQKRLMQLQAELNEKAAQAAYQRQIEMFDRENAYNSPLAQKQRYEAAGINPGVAMAGSPGAGATADGGSPAMSSGAGLGSVPAVPNFMGTAVDIFGGLASAMRSLSEAKKNGIETRQYERTINYFVRKFKADTEMSELLTEIQRKFGDRKVQAELMKLASEYDLNDANSFKAMREAMYTWSLENMNKEERARLQTLFPFRKRQEEAKAETYEEETRTQRALTVYNFAAAANQRSQAAYNKALTETENKLRDKKVGLIETQQLSLGAQILFSAISTLDNHEKIMQDILQMKWERQKDIFEMALKKAELHRNSDGALSLGWLGEFGVKLGVNAKELNIPLKPMDDYSPFTTPYGLYKPAQ